jgi:undecaprenyl-diphosphatase
MEHRLLATARTRSQLVRSSSDTLRLLTAAIVVVAAIVLIGYESAFTGAETDLARWAVELPRGLTRALVGITQLAAIGAVVAVAVAVWRRRSLPLLASVVLAGTAAVGLYAITVAVLDGDEPVAFLEATAGDGWVAGAGFPDGYYLAAAAAVLTALVPWLSRPWRRLAWALLWLGIIARLASATLLPGTMLLSVGIGWLAGAAVLFILGAPRALLSEAAIIAGLAKAGHPVRTLEVVPAARLRPDRYLADKGAAACLFVKTRSDTERSADLLYRVYRWARARNLGDERPFASSRAATEHEARCARAAESAGVETPHLATLADIDRGHSFVLAYEWVPGRSLDSVPPDEVSEDLARGLWHQVGGLRARSIAHRDLRLANLLLADDGRALLLDFGFGELDAGDARLAQDVAELLVSTALLLGAKRAVHVAVEVLGPAPVAAAVGGLRPGAVTGASRAAVEGTDLLDELRATAEAQTAAEDVRLAP